MNIVFVGPFGLQPKGTMKVRALPLAKALVKKGHTVTILIPPWDDPERAGQNWEEDDVRIDNVPLPPNIPLLFHILLTRTLVSRTLKQKPDIIHFFKPKAYAGLAHFELWWRRRLRGSSAKLILDTDDWEQAWNDVLPYSDAQKKLFSWQEPWGLQHADAVTAASRELEKLTHQIRGQITDTFYVPNGYLTNLPDSGDLQPHTIRGKLGLGQAPVILLYTRFVEFKTERIVSLVQRVAKQMPEARWLIVGQGLQGEEQQLADKLTDENLIQFVRFAGWVSVEHLRAYFAVADLAIHPYDDTIINRTKCSVKLIDLLVSGIPVVADAVGQNCEYIQNNVSGVLVPPADNDAFTDAVVDLLQSAIKRESYSRAASAYVRENFNWDLLSEEVEKAYQ